MPSCLLSSLIPLHLFSSHTHLSISNPFLIHVFFYQPFKSCFPLLYIAPVSARHTVAPVISVMSAFNPEEGGFQNRSSVSPVGQKKLHLGFGSNMFFCLFLYVHVYAHECVKRIRGICKSSDYLKNVFTIVYHKCTSIWSCISKSSRSRLYCYDRRQDAKNRN